MSGDRSRADARKVLMVAHAFAPGAGVAVQRTLSFARHLPDCGWAPTVLTVQAPASQSFDDQLARDTDGAAAVVRTAQIGRRRVPSGLSVTGRSAPGRSEPGHSAPGRSAAQSSLLGEPDLFKRLLRTWLLVPDEAIGWLPFAAARGSRLVARHRPQVIYSTSGPPTAHLVALLVGARCRLPWVADFRDPWTAVPNRVRRDIYSSASRLALDRALERAVLTRADTVVTVSEKQRQIMFGLDPLRDADRHHVITNGYEPEWLRGSAGVVPDDPGRGFTIGYTGSFYRAGEEPGPMLRAMAGLCDSRALGLGDVSVVVATPQHERVAAEVEAFGLGGIVSVLPPVPHEESIALQHGSTALWLALSAAHGEQGALTAKIFEYMAARRPVLAVVPPDSTAGSLIRSTGIGVAVDPRNIAGLQKQILRMHAAYAADGALAWRGSASAIAPYARPRLTEQLAGVLDAAAGRSSRSGDRSVHCSGDRS